MSRTSTAKINRKNPEVAGAVIDTLLAGARRRDRERAHMDVVAACPSEARGNGVSGSRLRVTQARRLGRNKWGDRKDAS